VAAGIIAILWLSLHKVLELALKLPGDTFLHTAVRNTQEFMKDWRSPFHAYMVPVFGALVILLVGLLASRFGAGNGEKREPANRAE
jgi:hypothetical protein